RQFARQAMRFVYPGGVLRQRHVGPRHGERVAHGAAESARRAGDQGHLAIEAELLGHWSTTDPSTCRRVPMGRGLGGYFSRASGANSMPIPGTSGMIRKPSSQRTVDLTISLLGGRSSPVGYSWMAKLGIQAATCKQAAVLTGESGLWGTTPTWCASASAAI